MRSIPRSRSLSVRTRLEGLPLEDGDRVVLIAGKPLGSVHGQDALAILRIGDHGSGFRAHDEE